MTFTLAHTLARSRRGLHGGATGGNRRILRRYDLLSIQARLPLFAPRWRRLLRLVEQRTQAALGAFTNRRALPGYSHPKNGSPRPALLGLPLSGKPPCFSTLIHFCCRPKSISSSSCSLPPILLTQRHLMEVAGGLNYQYRSRGREGIYFMCLSGASGSSDLCAGPCAEIICLQALLLNSIMLLNAFLWSRNVQD